VLDFSKNHFELFGLPASFAVEADKLSERYRALQQTLHPDRFAAASDQEKRLSMQASILINEAYRTLKDPLSRAKYLLALHTGEVGSENETTRDMAFLMEQMDLREALAAAKRKPDPYAEVEDVMDRLDALSRQLVGELGERFDDPSEENLEQSRDLVRKLQFVDKCRVEAERVEAELDEGI
jgi:molecular chaperone HscB